MNFQSEFTVVVLTTQPAADRCLTNEKWGKANPRQTHIEALKKRQLRSRIAVMAETAGAVEPGRKRMTLR